VIDRFFYLLALLLLVCVVQCNAQTAATVPGVFPNTNVIQSFKVDFGQGTCNDGTNVYWFGTQGFIQLKSNYQNFYGCLYANAPDITNGLVNFGGLHLGDPDYYQGFIYSPLESGVGAPLGAANIDIAIFSVTNLHRCAAISISNYQSEVSAVCIDANLSNSVALFASSWASASTNDGIYEYSVNNLTNLTFVRALPMTQHINHMQGIVCVAGMLYVLADNGPAGEIYQVNPTNGVVVHLAQINVSNESEWEGLDYFQGFLVANEGGSGTANWFDFFGVLTVSNQNINGSVLDSNNHPVAGVGVSASATINGTNLMMAVDTDTNGNYSMIVPGGNWNISLNATNGSDSLDSILGAGNYTCPNSQNVSGVYYNTTANFLVQFCNVAIVNASSLPAGAVGFVYNQALQASSYNPTFTWSQTGGSLPAGLSLSTNGILSGTPIVSGGLFNFTVMVTDGNGSTAAQSFSLNISNHKIFGSVRDSHNRPIVGVGVIATAIAGTNSQTTVITDTNGNYSVNVLGGSWSVALNNSSSGNSLSSLGSYSVPNSQIVSLVNSTATANFIVQTCDGVSIVTPSMLPSGEVGVAYNQSLQASSCNSAFTWAQTGGLLPSGLSLSAAGNISGTPSGFGGVFNFTAQVSDGNNFTTNQSFSIGISNAVQIATTSLPDSTSCNIGLTATNGVPPYVWSLSPGSAALPSNLTLTANGLLSGMATTNGTFNFSVRVTDALAATADQPLGINLLQPLTISISGGQIIVLWPASATNYFLQSAASSFSANWQTVSGAQPGKPYIVSNTAPCVFFRLH
jgi:hypothetical protein